MSSRLALTGTPYLVLAILTTIVFGIAVIIAGGTILLFGMDLLANFMSVWEPTLIGGVGEDDISGSLGTGFTVMAMAIPVSVIGFLALLLFLGGDSGGR